VDNSGIWGRGGFFDAIDTISEKPKKYYELAGKGSFCKYMYINYIYIRDIHVTDNIYYLLQA